MSLDIAGRPAPRLSGSDGWRRALTTAVHCALALLGIAIVVQALIVVEARPQDLITGIHGMADIIWRAMPPDFSKLPAAAWPTLQTLDIALFGTMVGIVIAVPLALLAAANMTPSRYAYYAARAIIGFTRAVPDLVWALLFVTAVGLGPFPGGLALGVHSVGMLGRLFAETIEQMDMAPIHALELTGAQILVTRAELELLQMRAQLQVARNHLEDVLHTPLSGPELALAKSVAVVPAGGS